MLVGLACAIEAGRPVVRGVAVDGDTLVELLRFAARADDDWPQQLRSLQTAIATELKHRDLTRVVVRRMDFDNRRRLTQEVSNRVAADGVIIAAARAECDSVHVLTGREIGEAHGTSKGEVLRRAGTSVSPKFCEAGAAALAASVVGR